MSETKARMRRIIERLPHYALVKDRVDGWIDRVLAVDPDRGVWHASRLSGFCGSEIGALCAGLLGDHAEADRIVRGKLLIEAPAAPEAAQRRAHAMEPIHRMMFHEKHSALPDQPSIRSLSVSHGPRPWMRYSPDDVVLLRTGERWLVNYCSPAEPHYLMDIDPTLSASLALGRLVADYNGIELNRLVLSEMSWKEWDTRDHEVIRHVEVEELIQDAGEHYWAMVQRGEVITESRRDGMDGKNDAEGVALAALAYAYQRQRCAA